jgi:hypothetical protein
MKVRQGYPVGPFGNRWISSLRENDPERYQTLKAGKLLEREAEAVQALAETQYQETLEALQEENGPPPTDPLAWDDWMRGLANAAREATWPLVLVPKPGMLEPPPALSSS